MPWPYRTGLPTMNLLARAIQKIGVKYATVQENILTVEQFNKIVALLNCISDFLSDVPTHDPTE